MTSRSQVVLASKRAEAWLEFVDTIAALGRLARTDPAIELLQVLQDECSRYGDTLEASLSTFAALSDGPVRWVGGMEQDDNPSVGHPKFYIWASAHQAALEIPRIALSLLNPPLESDADPRALRALSERLLIERWRTIVIPPNELAVLKERTRRERWKLVHQRRPFWAKDDDVTGQEVS